MTNTTYTTYYTRVAVSGKTVVDPEPTQVQLRYAPPLTITSSTDTTYNTDWHQYGHNQLNRLDQYDCL